MEPYQFLPLRVRVDLGARAMKWYSIFPKAPNWEPCHMFVSCHIQDTRWGWGLTLLQRYNHCILQPLPQPTGLKMAIICGHLDYRLNYLSKFLRWSLIIFINKCIRTIASSLLLYSQRFDRYILRPSSGVSCRTQGLTRNFELNPLFNRGRLFHYRVDVLSCTRLWWTELEPSTCAD